MHRTIRLSLCAALAALPAIALSALTAGTASAADDPQERAAQTIVLTATRSVFSLPATVSVGTSFVAGGELADSSGVQVGEAYSTCAVATVDLSIPPGFTALCTTTFDLSGGQIYLSSLRHYQPLGTGFASADLAVVGGTGEYATARGDATAVRIAAAPVTYQFTLNVTTDS